MFSNHRDTQDYLQNKIKHSVFDALRKLRVIGCIQDADPSLSQNYKSIVLKKLKAKDGKVSQAIEEPKKPVNHHDLDRFIASWVHDPETEAALKSQRVIL